MDIEASVHPRRTIERLGLAPLTSMFWFSETAKPTMVDWRPEVHDSDGLAIWTGSAERIWRPLNNPPQITISRFLDAPPPARRFLLHLLLGGAPRLAGPLARPAASHGTPPGPGAPARP